MRQTKQWLLVLLLLAGTTASFGQVAEFSFSGGQSLLRNNVLTSIEGEGGSTEIGLKDGFRFGFRITLNNFRFAGNEFGYAYNRTKLDIRTQPAQELGMAIHQGFYNFLVYAVPEGGKVRPFFTGGAHFSNFVPHGTSVTSGGGSTKFGLNYGGGLKVRVASMFLIRMDVRQYHTPKPDFFVGPAPQGWLRQIDASAGFALAL